MRWDRENSRLLSASESASGTAPTQSPLPGSHARAAAPFNQRIRNILTQMRQLSDCARAREKLSFQLPVHGRQSFYKNRPATRPLLSATRTSFPLPSIDQKLL
jgi:hypothetical protein